MHNRILQALCSLFLLVAPLSASAIDYSDIWWNPAENGWGVNIAQSDNFIFATFFIYGAGNLPTWYAGNLAKDANGNYSGGLYATTGPYFGANPYNPAQYSATQVGVATFSPTGPDTAILSYNVGGTSVLKNIQRQTLTGIPLGAPYSGAQAGTYSGSSCSLGDYKDYFDLQLTQLNDGTATFEFTYLSGLSCTLSGTLQQRGMLYSISTASYSCSDGTNTSASLTEIKATSLGIEGRLAAASVGSGCREDATFSGVLTN